jgi:alkylhydroperoxidase family enzyme
MSWIRTIGPEDAEGLLKRLYGQALQRAGKIYNIIRLQSPRPEILRASTDLYLEVMHGAQSPLSRAQREMIATAVSRANACYY